MQSPRVFAFLLAAFLAPCARADVAGTLTAKLAGPTLPDFPLLLDLTLTNTGTQPLHYWSGGPADYPQGRLFTAIVRDGRGTARRIPLSNGQNDQGSGTDRPIEKTLTFPASLPPLPPGDYTLTIESAENRAGEIITWPALKLPAPLKFTVASDPAAFAKARDDLWARWDKEPFAKYALYAYDLDSVVHTRLLALLDPDPKIAFSKLGGFMSLRWLGPADAAVLLQAAQLHVKDTPPDFNLLSNLAHIAANVSNDATLPITLLIAHSQNSASSSAVVELARYPHSPAIENTLLEFSKDPAVQFQAMWALATYDRPEVIPYMALAVHSHAPSARFALQILAHFRDRAPARQALEAAANDPDSTLASDAKLYLSLPATQNVSLGLDDP